MAIHQRISENSRYDSAMDRLSLARFKNHDTHETAASGRKLKRISDDPVASVQVMRAKHKINHVEHFKRTVEFGKAYLAKSEEALQSIYDSLVRVKELAIQQANTTYSNTERKAVAVEIKRNLDLIVNMGNTSYNDKYVFGGFQTKQPPISPDGSYMGDDGKIFVQFDENRFTPINISGRSIFGVPPGEEDKRIPLVQVLNNLHDSLDNYDKDKLHQSMVYLDRSMDGLLTEMATIGSNASILNGAVDTIDRNEIQLNKDINNLESADMVKSALDMRRAESALQYNMQATSKMITPSLLEFLR